MARSIFTNFGMLPPAVMFFFLAGVPFVYGQNDSFSSGQPQSEFFEYRLHQGEALGDVAQLFHLSVGELEQFNNISDPTRLQVGQLIKIPNIFARQVAELRGERSQLLTEKTQLVQQRQKEQLAVEEMKILLQRTQAENDLLLQDLDTLAQWQLAARTLSLVLLGMFAWGLLINKSRAERGRQVATLLQENRALEVTRERYRITAAQLEFRYQKLYSGRTEKPSQLVTEGATLLSQTFMSGCAELERCLSAIKGEREKEEQLLKAEQRVFDLLRHPFRELQQWYRLKYHSA